MPPTSSALQCPADLPNPHPNRSLPSMNYSCVSVSLCDGSHVTKVGRPRHPWPGYPPNRSFLPWQIVGTVGHPMTPFSGGKHVLYVYTPSPSRCRILRIVVTVSSFERRFPTTLFLPENMSSLTHGLLPIRSSVRRRHDPLVVACLSAKILSSLSPSFAAGLPAIPAFVTHISIWITACYLPISLTPTLLPSSPRLFNASATH